MDVLSQEILRKLRLVRLTCSTSGSSMMYCFPSGPQRAA